MEFLFKSAASTPPIIQGAIVLLLLGFLAAFGVMYRERNKVLGILRDLLSAVRSLEPTPHRPGVTLGAIEAIRGKCGDLGGEPAKIWKEIDRHVERYTSPDGEDTWLLSTAPRAICSEEAIAAQHYHHSFHQAVPGIFTSVGLLATFLSILVALAGVTVKSAQVEGIEGLINGLSGKFWSSIVGLILAIFFTIVERKWAERRISMEYEALMDEISLRIPTLTPLRVQLDIQRFMAQQTVSLSNISSDFVNKFTGVFEQQIAPAFAAGVAQELAVQMQQEFRPTMQQMAGTLERLQHAIELLQSQKQESLTAELKGLLESLEASMKATLGEMGRTFHDSLSSAATAEFTGIAETLKSTGHVLETMNVQFGKLQSALDAVIDEARQTTASQLSSGKEQMEAMTRLMESLLGRLDQSAKSNVDSVTAALAAVVSDLSGKVTRLTEDMMGAISRATETSQQSAEKMAAGASAWTEATATKLETLVSSIEARSREFEKAGKLLLAAEDGIRRTLADNQSALGAIQSLTSQMEATAGTLKQAGVFTVRHHEAQIKTEVLFQQATVKLNELIEATKTRHEEMLRENKAVLDQYQRVFAGLDKQLERALASVNEGMRTYNNTVEQNFRVVVEAANKTIPGMAQRLKAEAEDLAEKIAEMGDILSKGIERLKK